MGHLGTDTVLGRYSRSYEMLARFCGRSMLASDELLLRFVQECAIYASTHHPGRLADGAIENVALEIGMKMNEATGSEVAALQQVSSAHRSGKGARRVLHVTPYMWRVGGHTRTLQNWINIDTDSQHTIVITHAMDPLLVGPVSIRVQESGGGIFVLSGVKGLSAKARILRAIARNKADLVVLHHTCNDAVPVAAFAIAGLPPVALVNDCDQAFWLGSTVTDVIVNQREAGARLSRERRYCNNNVVLPIPLSEPTESFTRYEARRRLGIRADAMVLLTVGRALKYRPSATHDFFRVVRTILEREERAHLYAVGINEQEAVAWGLEWKHPRIHLCGAVADWSEYRASADVYLESMPFGSATALMEAAFGGLPAVLPFDPPSDLFVTNHGFEAVLANPVDADGYVEKVLSLLHDSASAFGLGNKLIEHIRLHHWGDGWRRKVVELYGVTDTLRHEPRCIPTTVCAEEPLDMALAEWQHFLNREEWPGNVDAVRSVPLTIAWEARAQGALGDAIAILWRYFGIYGLDMSSLRMAVGLPVHAARHALGLVRGFG